MGNIKAFAGALWEVQNITGHNRHLYTYDVVHDLKWSFLLAAPACGAGPLASLNEDRFTHILRGGGIKFRVVGHLHIISIRDTTILIRCQCLSIRISVANRIL